MRTKQKTCKVCGIKGSEDFKGLLCKNCYNEKQRNKYHEDPSKSNSTSMKWREKNIARYRETQRIYHKERYNDPDNRMKTNTKNRFSKVLRQWVALNKLESNTTEKLRDATVANIEKLIKCSMSDFVNHCEKKWLERYGERISWGNLFIPNCPIKIELEHIKPVRDFNFIKEGQKEKCWHYSNLELLTRRDNQTGRPRLH